VIGYDEVKELEESQEAVQEYDDQVDDEIERAYVAGYHNGYCAGSGDRTAVFGEAVAWMTGIGVLAIAFVSALLIVVNR